MHEKTHPGHDHEEHLPCDPLHDKNCPIEHHHHCGTACHVTPMISENDIKCRAPWSPTKDQRPLQESDLMPEDPYLSSEKPPII
jgi:hypothetical protein